MASLAVNAKAPDFELVDFNGKPFKLSDFAGKNHVFIVLNRGFV